MSDDDKKTQLPADEVEIKRLSDDDKKTQLPADGVQIKRPCDPVGKLWTAAKVAVHLASGEWMLRNYRANGGTIIFLRSLQASALLYLIAVWFRSLLYSEWPWHLDFGQFRHDMGDTLPWLGAIFAGVYVGLYARFSAQWSYLAEAYNQLMATQAQIAHPDYNPKIQSWKVALVEDADDLHLATKKMFSILVFFILNDETLGSLFEREAADGKNRRAALLIAVRKAIGEDKLPCD